MSRTGGSAGAPLVSIGIGGLQGFPAEPLYAPLDLSKTTPDAHAANDVAHRKG